MNAASFNVATSSLYVFVAVCCALLRVRSPRDAAYGPLAALGMVLFAFDLVRASEGDARVAAAFGAFAAALVVCFAAAYVATPHALRWYAGACAFAATGAAIALSGPEAHASAADLAVFPRALGWRALVLDATATAAIASSVWLLRHVGAAEEQKARAVTVGCFLLFAVALSDTASAARLYDGMAMQQLGYVAFTVGAAASFILRYVAVAQQVEAQSRELASRTDELRRSYQDLATAQQQLVRREQLAVVGELAAVVAHEVRNPLAIIANAVAGLRKPTLSRADHGTLLGILDEETVRLNRLVSDLLRFARPVSVQRTRIPISDLVERALKLARKEESVEVVTDYQVEGAKIWCDPGLLRQVFDNLVENAVQAMSNAGTLTVVVRSDSEEGIDGIAVRIIDTGEGMDTIVKQRAKDPFFTTRPSGTGLGLAIVDRIVVAHGGHLLIDSRTGEGTTVTVFLPSGTENEPPPLAPTASIVGLP